MHAMTIVRYEHRYKRPPRKKKPVALAGAGFGSSDVCGAAR
jgi:hypothetical protein